MTDGKAGSKAALTGADGLRHEFRAATVFYGGVSLAVYENGVARAFFDAATGAGLFAPLLDLIDTRFIVDVVSGSSAGGINGLLLAAALERGYPFAKTAELWRLHGGIEDLLRPASEEEARSLLRGETYYLTQLRRAFRDICLYQTPADYEAPQEIDVFVTGTDLVGVDGSFQDAFQEQVPTRMHRLVFHLQHRHERKELGYLHKGQDGLSQRVTADSPHERALQADILASVSRITSSFPGAFPPFSVAEFDQNPSEEPGLKDTRELVRYALGRLCGHEIAEDSQLIDGGVLDNRPFSALLQAVFHRMPFQQTSGLTRRVFYVDPDPDVFKQKSPAQSAGSEPPLTPLAVAVNSVVALPSYDSIAADVDSVTTHNKRMAHLRAIRKRIAALPDSDHADTPLYVYALERELMALLNGAELPSPQDPDGDEQAELEQLAPGVSALRSISINYHLRRAVSMFYGYASARDRPAVAPERDPEAFYRVGRVVKALKLLRDVWTSELRKVSERNAEAQRSAAEQGKPQPLANVPSVQPLPPLPLRHRLLRHYLGGSWIQSELGWDLSKHELSSQDLCSENLSLLAVAARKELQRWLGPTAPDAAALDERWATAVALPASPPEAFGLLGLLARHLEGILAGAAASLEDFQLKDRSLYPIELASGTHELDEVQIVRISPDDPKLPAELKGLGHSKLTGDELAHFSAFLRRDFRTNDVAWGHVDSIERITRALLESDGARQRAARRLDLLAPAFSPRALAELVHFDDARPELRGELSAVTQSLASAFAACRAQGRDLDVQTWDRFLSAFTTAAQTLAAREYIDLIVADAEVQNQHFNWPEAHKLELRQGDALSQLVRLRLGDTPVIQALPPSVVVEYAARAGLLLWGMVELSMGKAKPLGRARPFVVGFLSVIHALAALVRTERRAAAHVLFGTFAASLTLIVATWFVASAQLLAFGIIGVALCVLGAWWLGSLRFVKAVGISGTLLALGATLWLLAATSVCIRLPGGRVYPLNAADDFCASEHERAERPSRSTITMAP